MTTVVLPRTLTFAHKGRPLIQIEADLVCEVRRSDDLPTARVRAVMVENVDILDCHDGLLELIARRMKIEAEADTDFQAAAVEKAGYVMSGDPRDPSSKWEGPRL